MPVVAIATGSSGPFPEGVPEALAGDTAGVTVARLYQRLGFPYADRWRIVPFTTTHHGLAVDKPVRTNIPVSKAVIRGRSRALPFFRPPTLALQPPPGAVIYMDFLGPLIPSFPHKYTAYCGACDAGSGFGQSWPTHGMTADVASSACAKFISILGAKLGFNHGFKPCVIRTDQGSAFISNHFREFSSALQSQLTFSATYTPQQNSHIEHHWGMTYATARVLLAAANLPPSFHPFAMQTADRLLS